MSYCWLPAPVKLRRSVAMPSQRSASKPLMPHACYGDSLRAHPFQPRRLLTQTNYDPSWLAPEFALHTFEQVRHGEGMLHLSRQAFDSWVQGCSTYVHSMKLLETGLQEFLTGSDSVDRKMSASNLMRADCTQVCHKWF